MAKRVEGCCMSVYTYMDLLSILGIGGAHPGGIKATDIMLGGEPIGQQTVILDAGCGTGQTSAYLSSRYGAQVLALDNHPIMAEKARQRFSMQSLPIQVIESSLEAMPLASGSVDYCLSESVLSFADFSASAKEIHRVLKENGVLYAIELTMDGAARQEEKQVIGSFYGFRQMWNEEEWAAAFYHMGFRHVEIRELPSFYDDEEPLTDFYPSENIPEQVFQVLSQHEQMLKQYRHLMNYRIIRAQK
ncbi:class I SAM-dependent methyltransferase [Pradoshia sp.]